MVNLDTAPLPIISNSDTYIINFGGNKHMTNSFKDFLTYFPCTQQENICVVDGSYTPVSETNSINCISIILMSSIIYVPTFSNNFLSISVFIGDFNCKIEFS